MIVITDLYKWGGPVESVVLESVTWGTHLLEGTLILNAFGSNKNPAVSEGQLLHRCASELLEEPPSLIVQPETKWELKVNISYLKKRRRQVLLT